MKPISDFFPRMLPYLPGCPEPVAEQAILDAAIAFCESAQVLRAELPLFNTTPGVAVYALMAPAQHQVARVLDVVVGRRALSAAPSDLSGLPSDAHGAPATYFVRAHAGGFQLHLHPRPDEGQPIRANVVLRPTRTATQLDPTLFDLWADAVLAGATARAMAIPGQPFSDPHGSMAYSAAAFRAASRARIEGGTGHVRPSLRVKSAPFA